MTTAQRTVRTILITRAITQYQKEYLLSDEKIGEIFNVSKQLVAKIRKQLITKG